MIWTNQCQMEVAYEFERNHNMTLSGRRIGSPSKNDKRFTANPRLAVQFNSRFRFLDDSGVEVQYLTLGPWPTHLTLNKVTSLDCVSSHCPYPFHCQRLPLQSQHWDPNGISSPQPVWQLEMFSCHWCQRFTPLLGSPPVTENMRNWVFRGESGVNLWHQWKDYISNMTCVVSLAWQVFLFLNLNLCSLMVVAATLCILLTISLIKPGVLTKNNA